MKYRPRPAVRSSDPLFPPVFVHLASLVLAVACLYWGKTLLIPVALASLLTFLLAPVVNAVQARGLSRVPTVLVVVACTAAVIVTMGWIVLTQASDLALDLKSNPTYRRHLTAKLQDVSRLSRGKFADVQAVIQKLGDGPEKLWSTEGAPTPAVVVRQETSLLSTLETALMPLVEPIGSAALVVVLVIFMLLRHEDLRSRMVGLFGAAQLPLTTRALRDAGERISRYLMMQFLVNLTYGVAIGCGLFIFSVPYNFLWGFLAAVLRYIPYIGPWVAALFPLVITSLAFDGWSPLLYVGGLFLVCELLSNMIMEPVLYGSSIGASEVALLVATGFWAWLWGPVGLVLAAPLTVCLIVLGQHVPALSPITILLGDQPALEPHANFYQRLLARDRAEAEHIVRSYAKENGPERTCDEVIIPALLTTRLDKKRGTIERDDERFVLENVRALADEALSKRFPAEPANPISPIILGCAARDEFEELAASLLQFMEWNSHVNVTILPSETLQPEIADAIRTNAVTVVFLAVFPGGLPQARFLSGYLSSQFPHVTIIAAYWGKKGNFDKALVHLRRAGTTYLTTSLAQTRQRIESVTSQPQRLLKTGTE